MPPATAVRAIADARTHGHQSVAARQARRSSRRRHGGEYHGGQAVAEESRQDTRQLTVTARSDTGAALVCSRWAGGRGVANPHRASATSWGDIIRSAHHTPSLRDKGVAVWPFDGSSVFVQRKEMIPGLFSGRFYGSSPNYPTFYTRRIHV